MHDTNTDVNDNVEQQKGATMQLVIEEYASRMALVLQEVDQTLKVLSPET